MSTHWVSSDLQAWLAEHAQSLHESNVHADKLLPLLTSSGLVQMGVPTQWGGTSGSAHHAVEAIAEVAEQSLTAAFVLWAQRAFIEYLCVTDNPAARDFWLPQVLPGHTAGATGLSNAMKFLSALETLQVLEDAPAPGAARTVSGLLPWVTNLRQPHFAVAAAVQAHQAGRPPLVVVLDSQADGLTRSPDLDLLGLRGSNTAAITLQQVVVPEHGVLAEDGQAFLKRARPMFLGLQCGMSLGLIRAALHATEQKGSARDVLRPRIEQAWQQLDALRAQLFAGLNAGRFEADAPALFHIRLQLAALAQESIQLELQGSGGRAYLRNHLPHFGRRLQEAAFVPVVTPSLTQLQGELQRHQQADTEAALA